MTAEPDQILSEFIDAWNAGERPDVDDYLQRAPAEARPDLAERLIAFLSVAPTPEYTHEALAAIRAEPAVRDLLEGRRAGVLPQLLAAVRTRLGLSATDVAGQVVRDLELADDRSPKTAAYLERLERGDLNPASVSRRVFAALGRILGIPRDELEAAADLGAWSAGAPAPVFRADKDAAEAVSAHLEVLADALDAPGAANRDEVDELFFGGR